MHACTHTHVWHCTTNGTAQHMALHCTTHGTAQHSIALHAQHKTWPGTALPSTAWHHMAWHTVRPGTAPHAAWHGTAQGTAHHLAPHRTRSHVVRHMAQHSKRHSMPPHFAGRAFNTHQSCELHAFTMRNQNSKWLSGLS